MAFDDTLMTILGLVAMVPSVLVLGGGFVFALVRRRRHPRASWLVAIGCVLILLATVGSQFLFGGVFRWLSEQDWLPGRMEYKLFAVSLATGLPVTLAYLLFLLAAFADRPADDFKEEG